MINCIFCDEKGKCNRIPKLFGVFKRNCIYINDVPHYKCHLQREISNPPTKEELQEMGIIP